MDIILDSITQWLREILVGGIMDNLTGLFDQVNTKVGEIAGQVGQTPQAWNSSVYNMIRTLSDNVIVPIAGIVLAFVMTVEFIQLIIDRNNMHDFETFVFFKWIFKTACAVLIVTNTWNIVMAVFDVAQTTVNSAAGIIVADTAIPDSRCGGPAHGNGHRAAVWTVVPKPACGYLHVGADYLHLPHHLWQND